MKNNLKKILENRGFRKVLLTEECLISTGMKTTHRFNKILENEADITAAELNGIAAWLGVSMQELLQTDEQN